MIKLKDLMGLSCKYFPEQNANVACLLYAWAKEDPDKELSILLERAGLTMQGMIDTLEEFCANKNQEDDILFNQCISSFAEGSLYGQHLLLKLCSHTQHQITKALNSNGLDVAKLKNVIEQNLASEKPFSPVNSIAHNANYASLEKYGRNLTELAAQGAFDDLHEREKELKMVANVLLKKNKGNVVLTGSAGVGKTSIVETFARQLVTGNAPKALTGVQIIEIRLGDIVAGTKYRGEFEERLKQIISTLLANSNVVLFVDEMHLLWGAGRAEGAPMDAANMLKPFLARGQVRIIGATTTEEFHQYIAKDKALARRFEEVHLLEPEASLIYQIAKTQSEALEKHHGVQIPENAIKQAIELTDRHMPNRYQPDKTVDLLDTTSVHVLAKGKATITSDDLLEVLSQKINRPISTLQEKDRKALIGMADKIKQHIIGQDHAVDCVIKTLAYRRQGLGNEDRCIGTFLFAGASGVGKTELARILAKDFYGDKAALLHLDLAEYNSAGSVNKLIGAAPGYIGSERDGILTNFLNQRGSGVLLYDEIEKAHPDVHKFLLGQLDNGRICSSRGDHLDTRQCVIIVTTNVLTPEQLNIQAFGFNKSETTADAFELLNKHFPHEFLGRFDELIVFNKLEREAIQSIAKMRLNEAFQRLKGKGICIEYEEDYVLNRIMSELQKNNCGARGIMRLIETMILQPISFEWLRSTESSIEIILDEDFFSQEDHMLIV